MTLGSIPRHIIIIDDDVFTQKMIAKIVNYDAKCFTSSAALIHEFPKEEPLSVFLDVHLSSHDNGLDLIPSLKERWPYVPILVVTGGKDDEALSTALSLGADDFIYKPFKPKELLARMQVRIEAMNKQRYRSTLQFADIIVDTEHRSVANGEIIRFLSPTEFNLLKCLMTFGGVVVTRDVLKQKCWGQVHVTDNALNRKLHSLRKTLQEVSSEVEIRTLYGSGFKLEQKTSEAV